MTNSEICLLHRILNCHLHILPSCFSLSHWLLVVPTLPVTHVTFFRGCSTSTLRLIAMIASSASPMQLKPLKSGTGEYILLLTLLVMMLCSLILIYRPISEGGNQRIPPDALLGHCQTHCFLGPGCLCSSQSINENFSESLIFMVTSGQHAGQWIAACATRQCKYWSESCFVSVQIITYLSS